MATASTLTAIYPPERIYTVNGHLVTFFVNNNTVVAKLMQNCSEDALNEFEFNSEFLWEFGANKKNHRSFALMSRHPFGKAKCDPRDTFDLEFGKRLAYKRLKVAYWSQFENRLGKINDYLLRLFEENSQKMTRISEKYLQEED